MNVCSIEERERGIRRRWIIPLYWIVIRFISKSHDVSMYEAIKIEFLFFCRQKKICFIRVRIMPKQLVDYTENQRRTLSMYVAFHRYYIIIKKYSEILSAWILGECIHSTKNAFFVCISNELIRNTERLKEV